jgi:hypothetical protein
VSNAASLAATLIAGPQQVQDTQFPSATVNIPFGLLPTTKAYNVDTGTQTPQVNSPSVFVTLSGIGTGQTVTQALTLYVRCLIPMQIRLTFSGDATPKVIYLQGVLLLEASVAAPITLLEAMGAGQVEFWASGNQ